MRAAIRSAEPAHTLREALEALDEAIDVLEDAGTQRAVPAPAVKNAKRQQILARIDRMIERVQTALDQNTAGAIS